jgi:hypothetical protein
VSRWDNGTCGRISSLRLASPDSVRPHSIGGMRSGLEGRGHRDRRLDIGQMGSSSNGGRPTSSRVGRSGSSGRGTPLRGSSGRRSFGVSTRAGTSSRSESGATPIHARSGKRIPASPRGWQACASCARSPRLTTTSAPPSWNERDEGPSREGPSVRAWRMAQKSAVTDPLHVSPVCRFFAEPVSVSAPALLATSRSTSNSPSAPAVRWPLKTFVPL